MSPDLDAVFGALRDPTRRAIYEQIVIRPRCAGDLSATMPATRQAVSHHLRVLAAAGLIDHGPRSISAIVELLPGLRTYFDRLWLEASLGDSWLECRVLQRSVHKR